MAAQLRRPAHRIFLHAEIERRLVQQRLCDGFGLLSVRRAPAGEEPRRQIRAGGQRRQNFRTLARHAPQHRVHEFGETARFAHAVCGLDGLAYGRVRGRSQHQQLGRAKMQQRARVGSAFGERALQETREHGVHAAKAAQTGGRQRTREGAVAAFQA
jgi:hypothetical protein